MQPLRHYSVTDSQDAALPRSQRLRQLEPDRIDFRSASGHLDRKRPGYYLILLRTELRHRTIGERPPQHP